MEYNQQNLMRYKAFREHWQYWQTMAVELMVKRDLTIKEAWQEILQAKNYLSEEIKNIEKEEFGDVKEYLRKETNTNSTGKDQEKKG